MVINLHILAMVPFGQSIVLFGTWMVMMLLCRDSRSSYHATPHNHDQLGLKE